LALGIVVIQALLVPLFAGPAANIAPRDLPVAAVGPLQQTLEKDGHFKVTTVSSADEADALIRDRSVYAAFIAGPSGLSLHTASAASPTVAALLTQASAQLGGGKPVPVTDIVPTDTDDPRGAGFGAGFLPLALTSMLAGIAIVFLVRTRSARLTGVLTYAVLAGLSAAAVLQGWLGVLPPAYFASALAIGLTALAISATMAGLGALLGTRGIGLGAVVVFLLGNALGAVAAAPELLPQPWGEVGQWLPVGAGATLLRSAAYFDWAGAAQPLLVLVLWAFAGLAFVVIGRWTSSMSAPAPAPASEPAVTVAA
jgi:hypothetical protein